MNLDRMELADCGTPEALVAAILKQVPDMPIPVPQTSTPKRASPAITAWQTRWA